MQITDLKIRKVTNDGYLKAYVTVTFDNCFVVHNLKIIKGRNGLFVAMPTRRTAKGVYKDIAHPLTIEFRTLLEDAVLNKYNEDHDIETVSEDE